MRSRKTPGGVRRRDTGASAAASHRTVLGHSFLSGTSPRVDYRTLAHASYIENGQHHAYSAASALPGASLVLIE